MPSMTTAIQNHAESVLRWTGEERTRWSREGEGAVLVAGSVAQSSLVAREPVMAEVRDDRRWEMVLTGGDHTSERGRRDAGRLRLGLAHRVSAGVEWAGRIRPRERERFSFSFPFLFCKFISKPNQKLFEPNKF